MKGTTRNFINIVGITDEVQLNHIKKGNKLYHEEKVNISLNDNEKPIKSIYESSISINIIDTKSINIEDDKFFIIDSKIKYNIIYMPTDNSLNANMMEKIIPYNKFIKLPLDSIVTEIKYYIVDAYLDLLTPKNIYSYLILCLNIHYISETKVKIEDIIQKDFICENKDEHKEEEFVDKEIEQQRHAFRQKLSSKQTINSNKGMARIKLGISDDDF